MTTSEISTKDLIKEFTKATINGDLDLIELLLDENGVFEITDSEMEIIETGKYEFLNYYKNALANVGVKESCYDQCIGCNVDCSFGSQVVLFNNGYFPKIQKDIYDREKIGFMIDGNKGKISKIGFCSLFHKTENKTIFECIGSTVVQFMKTGLTMGQALKKLHTSPEYEHYRFPDEEIDEDIYNNDERL